MIASALPALLCVLSLAADDFEWPLELDHPKAKIVMYQPQPEVFEGNTIKARAARLREAGTARVAAHLAAQVGKELPVLMENPHMGRTEQFTEVLFASDQPESQIVQARITGYAGTQLTA